VVNKSNVTHLARVYFLAAECIVVRPHFRSLLVDVLYSVEEMSLTNILVLCCQVSLRQIYANWIRSLMPEA
jgi:hypothetical protein